MSTAADFHGIIPPICTPLLPDGEVDTASLQRLVDFQLDAGVHGIFALGSTGEFALLTDRQKQTVIETTAAAVRGRAPLVVGILDTSTRRCIENARQAQEAGADALVLAAAYYYRYGQAEVMEHFRAVHAAVDLPVLAYDIPGTVGIKLETSTVVTLAREGVIAGMKDSSGVVDLFRQTLLETRDLPFAAFTGSELLVDLCLQMGATGSVPGLCNVFPAAYVKLYDLARAGDWSGAAAIQEALLTCFWELIRQGDPAYGMTASALGGFKTGLLQQGIIDHNVAAAPLHSFTAEETARVAAVMQRYGNSLANPG